MASSNNSNLPLYLQLTNQLRSDIQSGKYRPDDKLPTENDLCEMYNVSRITVRNALNALVKEHLLIKKQGLGTFVAHEKFKRDIVQGSSFSQICLETGLVPGAKTIKSVIETATAEDMADLQLPEGSRVISLERIRYAGGIPVALEISRFPESFAFLLDEDLNNASLISVLSEKHGITFGQGPKMIEMVFASFEIAHYLNVKEGYPLIAISCVSNDQNGIPAHRSLQYVVGDRFRFYIK